MIPLHQWNSHLGNRPLLSRYTVLIIARAFSLRHI